MKTSQDLKILIAGDSFAADWHAKYPTEYCGWPNLLSTAYQVTNLAQAGCSEYKILKQIQSADLSLFDVVVVSHTSPDRVHTITHPVHSEDLLHNQADLIFSDIEYHWHKHSDNLALASSYQYFKYHYDSQYYLDIYNLFRKEINSLLQDTVSVQITHFSNVDAEINFSSLHRSNQGFINHYSRSGNIVVFKKLQKIIEGKYYGKTI